MVPTSEFNTNVTEMKKHHSYEIVGGSSVAIYSDYWMELIKVLVSSLLRKRSLYQPCSAFVFLIEFEAGWDSLVAV